MTRQPRDTRKADEPRDERDERREGDPRDTRDPRLPGDPIDAAVAAGAAAAHRETTGIPRWVKVTALASALGLGGVGVIAWQLAALRSDQERARCERAVMAREDNRAMWLWVGDVLGFDPDPGLPDFLIELRRELDRRLPSLRCDGEVPVPITTEEP